MIVSKRSTFPLTEVSASEVSAILKKFVSKEATLEAANLKLHLAARPCLCDVIPSDSKYKNWREQEKPAIDRKRSRDYQSS